MDPTRWKTICVSAELYERINILRQRLDEAYTEGRSDIEQSDMTGEVTMGSIVERMVEEYEAHLDRSSGRRKDVAVVGEEG